jgi:hypothetical protein
MSFKDQRSGANGDQQNNNRGSDRNNNRIQNHSHSNNVNGYRKNHINSSKNGARPYSTSGPHNANGETLVVCKICGKKGHTVRECFFNPDNSNHKEAEKTSNPGQGRSGTGSDQNGQRLWCKSCKMKNHNTEDCTKNPGGGSKWSHPKLMQPQWCNFCKTVKHAWSQCSWNVERFGNGDCKEGSGKGAGEQRKPKKAACERCGMSNHSSHNCARNPRIALREQKNSHKEALGYNANPSFQAGNFARPPPLGQTVGPQFRNDETGRLSRRCRDCVEWLLDGCGNAHGKPEQYLFPAPKMKKRKEDVEFRGAQVLPQLQRTGWKWPCPKTDQYFDVDSEGDVIMLEMGGNTLPQVHL